MITRALLLTLMLAAPAMAEPPAVFKDSDWIIETPRGLIIRSDGGGNIHDYADLIATLQDKEVRIEGTCKSSCTMFLGLPRVCVSPQAVFGFHGPSSDNDSIRHLLALVDKIAAHHPAPIAERFRSDWGLTRDFTWLTGAELMALAPSIPPCL